MNHSSTIPAPTQPKLLDQVHLNKDMGEFKGLVWAKRPARLPEVLTTNDVEQVLAKLEGVFWLMGILMYGAGLRLLECLRLRVKDIDFTYKKITVREGKGQKDRVTMMPEMGIPALEKHLEVGQRRGERSEPGGFAREKKLYAARESVCRSFPCNWRSIRSDCCKQV